MKIGIAGPMTLRLLNYDFGDRKVPLGYDFSMISWTINGLLERGIKVVAYTTSADLDEPIVFEGNSLTVCIAPRFPHAGHRIFKEERRQLCRFMRDYPTDLLHAQWSYEFAMAALATGIPTLITVHDYATAILRYQFDSYRMIRWWMNAYTLRKARYLAAVSPYILRHIGERKARILPNFYDQKLETHYEPERIKRDSIISVSHAFDYRKNIRTALHAFALLRRKYPQLTYKLIGYDMSPGGAAYRYAAGNDLLDGVEFLGNLPFGQVVEEVKSSKVFLHTSREESFGLAVLEAMAVGTPVVGGTKSGNIPDLLCYGETGRLCNVESPQSIAEAVVPLLHQNDEYGTVIQKAYAFVRNNYSESVFFTKLLDYYRDILYNENMLK
jgi:L-malate glycosyltransferase